MKSSLIKELAGLLGEAQVSTQPEVLERFAWDGFGPNRASARIAKVRSKPIAVVSPTSTEEVSKILAFASSRGIPVVPFGGGTGVMGGAISIKEGIVLNLQEMDRILSVNPEDETAVVQPGVLLGSLNETLEQYGLMVGHDPWSQPIATVGGAISTNGVGYLAGRYGPMGKQVQGLEVVLADGTIIHTRNVLKRAGIELHPLFIGAEGSLGVITEVTLRVFPILEARRLLALRFPSFDDGFRAIVEMRRTGLKPSMVDYSEEDFPPPEEIMRSFESLKVPANLYLAFEGFREGVEAEVTRGAKICSSWGMKDLGSAEAGRFWKIRHDSAYRWQEWRASNYDTQRRNYRYRGRMNYLHVALPLSRVLEYRRRCLKLFSEANVFMRECSLWGQPELFSMLLMLPEESDQESIAGMAQAADAALALAQDMGGSLEYCHGVGVRLAHLFPRELGGEHPLLSRIKDSLDPQGIMNPGKLSF